MIFVIASVSESIRKPPLDKPWTAFKKIKYGEKRFFICRMEFLHPAMWHVALESWQWIHQVAAPCNVIRGSAMTCHLIEFAQTSAVLEFYIWFPFSHITAVDMSFCTSLRNIIQIGPPLAEKNDVMSIFKMADHSHLGLLGSNNGFFEKPS